MTRLTRTVLKAALIFLISIPVYSDTCNFPFPQNTTYPYGIKPNNFTNAQMNQHCLDWYNKWFAKYMTQNNAGGAWRLQRTETGNGITNGCYGFATAPAENDTVSEGIGYAMVIMVFMSSATNNTRQYFDGLYTFYKNNLDTQGLMNWQIPYCSSNNAATDADEDVTFALLAADKQWGSAGAINYKTEATSMIGKVLGNEITTANDIKPGDTWDGGNISYFAPYEYRMFGDYTSTARWYTVASHTYQTIVSYYYNSASTNNAALGIKTGLQPNWCNYDGTTWSPGAWSMDPNSWWWDAIRHAWRQSYDYLLYGTMNGQLAYDNNVRLSTFFQTKTGGDSTKILSHYTLDGTATTYNRGDRTPDLGTEDVRNLPGPEGAVSIAAMVEGDQAWLNNCYYTLVTMDAGTGSGNLTDTGVKWGTDYFCDILKMQYLLILTGNMPNPMGNYPTPTITPTPTFGPSPTPVPQGIFDDFETGSIVNLDTSGGGQTAFTSVANTTDKPQAGTHSLKIISTANGWGAYGQDSPYTGGLGYRNETGATALEFDIYTTANITYFIKLVEATASFGNAETFSNRNAQLSDNTANAWVHVSIPLSSLIRDTYSATGDNILNLSVIKSFYLQIDAAPNATIWIDNIKFTGNFPSPTPTYTITRTRTPAGTLTITPTCTMSATNTPYYSATFTATGTCTRTATYTATPSLTVTPSSTRTATNTQSSTVTPTGTRTATSSMTATQTRTSTITPSPTTIILSPSFTPTLTPTGTVTASPTYTSTGTQSATATMSQTPTFTRTWTFTVTPTSTRTATPSSTYTLTYTPTFTASPSATPTFTRSATPTGTATATYSASPTFSATRTMTATPTFTVTQTNSVSPTITITWTGTPPTPSVTPTITPTGTATGTPSATPTATGTFTRTPSPSATASVSPTYTYTITQTASMSPSGTNTITWTSTCTATASSTGSRTPTPTDTASPTSSPTETTTLTMTFTVTLISTFTFTATPSTTNTLTLTLTPTMTDTMTSTITLTPSITQTHTVSPTVTETVTGTPPTPTVTQTITQTWTASDTPTSTRTGTPSVTTTLTITMTVTLTATATPSVTRTVSLTASPSLTPSSTATGTATLIPSITVSPSSTWTSAATSTSTPTSSVQPTKTSSAVPTSTGSATRTGTPTVTLTLTLTSNPTGTPTFTATGQATATITPVTPTPAATTVVFEIKDPIVYPNPYNAGQPLNLQFYASRNCGMVSIKVYTVSLRLIINEDLGSCPAGIVTKQVEAKYFSRLANGAFYYVITGIDEGSGTKTRCKASELMILK